MEYRQSSLVLLNEAKSIERYFEGEYNLTLKESYIALAAPSLTGKTQTAFSIRSKIPFYFVFDSQQTIYEPFAPLSLELENCAIKDILVMQKFLKSKGIFVDPDMKYIDRSDFLNLMNVKSEVIGLLIALMEDAATFVTAEKPEDWFIHFSRSRNINFKPASIYEFMRHDLSEAFLKKYFIFLDEFSGRPGLVFLRNLFRYLEISCIVASTNAKILNLLGVSYHTTSRILGPRAWCLVFPRLPSISEDAIYKDTEFVGSSNSAIQKATNISEVNGSKMKNLFEYLKAQCIVSRPGFATIIVNESIKSIENGNFIFEDMFEGLLNSIYTRLNEKKPQAFDQNYANLILMLNGGIPNENYSEYLKLSDLIDNHFYYLRSPKNDNDAPFLLYRHIKPHIKDRKLANTVGYGPEIERFIVDSYFDVNEMLLMILCLYKGLRSPVMQMFEAPVSSRLTDNYNKRSKKRLGDAQENLALLSICDSSHKTFRGTEITEFLQGIIWNFNHEYPYFNITVEIPDSRILKSLESFKVPFMLPENFKIPETFKSMCENSKIHFGTYLMAKDLQQIDGIFDLVPVDGNFKKQKCLVEAKNRNDKLPESELLEIIKKGLNFSKQACDTDVEFPLHLTFSSKLKKFNEKNKASIELKELAFEHKINLLRFILTVQDDFNVKIELVEFSKSLQLFSDPKITSIFIDVETISEVLNAKRKNIKVKNYKN